MIKVERIISVSPLQMQKETLRLFKQFAGYLLFVFTFLLTAVTAYGQGVQFIAAETASGNSSNPSVNINGSRVSGDLLMAFVSAKNAPTMSDPPTGWLALGSGVFSGTDNSTYVFYKFSEGTETNFTITLSSGNRWAAGTIVYRNVNSINTTNFSTNNGSNGNILANAITPEVDSSLLIAVFGTSRTQNAPLSFSSLSGSLNQRFQSIRNDGGPNKAGILVADELRVSPVNTGTRQVTVTGNHAWSALLISLEPIVLSVPEPSEDILYSYQSGNWNDSTSWTRDPSGTTLIPEFGVLPVTGDSIVILNGRTITATADITTEGHGLRINGGGVLNMQTFSFTNLLRAMSGTGRFRSSRTVGGVTYLPTTLASNAFLGEAGGTVEYYCATATMTLNTAISNYYNLELGRESSGSVNYILASNLTLYGNLGLIRTGTATPTFTIGNDANGRNLTINGKLEVGEGCNLRVGTSNTLHTVSLGGDLINQGSVRFLNITTPNYTAEPSNGRATVTFTGLSDNRIDCFGETNFYRLVLDKGIDQTYILTVNSSNVNNFRLLGRNNQGNNPSQNPANAKPDIFKALTLNHGTIRLKENINIPSLTEGGDDIWVRSSSCMWIDGADVSTTTTDNGTGYQAITITGRLLMTAGTLTTNNAAGIIYTADGIVDIRGGTLTACQLRSTGAGQTAYIQSGGLVKVDGVGETSNEHARFHLDVTGASFTMSGGVLEIEDPTSFTNYAGLNINISTLNGNVTGGTVRLISTSATSINHSLRTTIPIYNLELLRTGGTGIVIMNSALTVLNNLTLSSPQSLQTNSNALTVGGNFTINSGATLVPGNSLITLNGSQRQTFTYSGAITGNIYRLTIDKAADSLVLAGTNNTLIVNDNFTFSRGALQDGGKTLELHGNVVFSGQHTGTGKISFTTATSRTIDGTGEGVIQNLDLDGPAANTTYQLNAALKISGTLNFVPNGANQRLFDIGANRLSLDTNASVTNFSSVRFIKTNGLQSASGLVKIFNSNTFTFPVGAGSSNKYTPAIYTLSQTPTVYGSVTVRPVNAEHPATTESNKALTYYWRVTSTGFTLGSAKVNKQFIYADADAVNGNENNYVPAELDLTNSVWLIASPADVNEGSNTITFAGPSYENSLAGEFTAGDNSSPSPFGAVTIYYSRVDGGAWNNPTTWTLNADHTTVQTPASAPIGNSIVRIGNGTINHTVLITANTALAGNLVIANGSTLDVQGFTGHNFGAIAGETVAGNGRLRIGKNASATFEFPGGDFGDFLGENGGEVEYYNNTANNATLPASLLQYRYLTLNASSTGNIDFPSANVRILDTLKINSSGSGLVRTYTADAAGGNLVTDQDLQVLNGIFEIHSPGSSGARNIEVKGNVFIGSGKTLRVGGASNTTHTLSVYGNITNNGTLDLRPLSTRLANLFVYGSNNSSLNGNGTSTILAGLTINKGVGRTAVFSLEVSGTLTSPGNNWLTITNGTFFYNRTGTLDIHNAASTYELSESASIRVGNGTVNIATANSSASDFSLRGRLEITGGNVNIGNSVNTTVNNDIIVAAAGTPEIVMSGGALTVNGQIRRSLTNQSGSLRYTQSGNSIVTIIGRAFDPSRGKIEVINPGSYFEMRDNSLLIINNGGAQTYADIYVRPDSSLVSGGTVRLIPLSTGGNQTYKFDLTYRFYNLEILPNGANYPTVELNVNSLIVDNNLTLATNGTLNCNNLNVSVGGKFLKQGTWNGGTNTLTFFGSNSELEGDFSTQTLNRLTVAQNAQLSLIATTNLRVNNLLTLENNAVLNDNAKTIDLKGNMVNNGTHNSPADASANTLMFTGTAVQEITGTGVFGNLVINNAAGVYLGGSMTINRRLTLTEGLLDIGNNQLRFGVNAPAVSGSFSATRMIRANGVLSDGGIVKNFPASAASFLYPIGVFGKYTPATVNITANSTSGSVQIRPVNTKHPSTRAAANNQLNYYWQVDSTGFSGVTATLSFNYRTADITGNEANYRGGRFVFPNWTPIGGTTGVIDTAANTITYTAVNYLSGGFTAGSTEEFAAVATYYSRNAGSGGNWNSLNTWSVDGHDGDPALELPVGAPIIIASGHTVTVTENNKQAESVQLNGTAILNLNATFAHNFGVFTGTGTMRISATPGEQFVFPGGNYDAFVANSGGTVEFYSSSPGILPTQPVYNKVILKDNAARRQPNVDIVVNGLFTLEAGSLSNITFGRNLEVRNNWENQVGASGYLPGTGTVIFNSANAQAIYGVTTFYKVNFAGGGSKTLHDSISVINELLLNGGRVYLGNHNIFLDSTANTGGNPSANAMLVQNGSGRLIKRLKAGQPVFSFPIGEESGTADYSPVTINITTGNFTANARLSVQVFDAVSNECSGANDYISRNWEFNSSGLSAYSVTITARYVDADVNGTESAIVAKMARPSQTCLDGDFANTVTNTLRIVTDFLTNLSGGEPALPEPLIQATLLTFGLVTDSSISLSVTCGDGASRIVLVRQGAAVNEFPEDFSGYQGVSSFGQGDELGSGNFVIYAGTDSQFVVVGLTAETEYHFAVIEFNGSGSEANYLLTNPAVGQQFTFATEPDQQVADLQIAAVSQESIRLKWTSGNGSRRLVLARADAPVNASPEDGATYTADAIFGQGTQLGSDNFVVFNSTIDSVDITGLDQNRDYYFQVFEFNGSGGYQNYLLSNAPIDSQYTYIQLALQAWLEGAWNGNDMEAALLDSLPTKHPYGSSPWNYNENDSVVSIPNNQVVDWVLVELRKSATAPAATAATIKARKAAFILKNGQIVGLDGSSDLVIDQGETGQYYVVLYHRTHLAVMSAEPIAFSGGAYRFNFKTAQNQAYGVEALLDLGGGNYGLYTGRVEFSTPNLIDINDRNAVWNDRNLMGYQPTDATLRGEVDASDRSKAWNNRNRSSQVP